MISKRQFFSIVLVFLAVFLLFQGTQLGKIYWNPYRQGSELSDTGLRQTDVWIPPELPEDETALQTSSNPLRICYVGSKDSTLAATVEEWTFYYHKPLRFLDSLPDSAVSGDVFLLNAPTLSDKKEAMAQLLAQGADILLLSPPNPDELRLDADLLSLLGIREVRANETSIKGIHLFPGFLLGGERIYAEQTAADIDRQDLPGSSPWYITGVGTKSYLQGIPTNQTAGMKNEMRPALFWRCRTGGGNLFAAALPFFEDRIMAFGMLSATMAQRTEWCLYPVVNARIVSMLNCPELSDENPDRFTEIYGREQTDMQKNIILPMLNAQLNSGGPIMSCFLAPQYDYSDDILPNTEQLEDFLHETGELRSELGLSLLRRSEISLSDKLAADRASIETADAGFHCSSICMDTAELPLLKEHLGVAPLENLRTIFVFEQDELPLLSFWEDNLTLQQLIANGVTHTFREDLRLLCLVSALGYSSDWFDMGTVLWPELEEEQWQIASQKLFSNLSTYSAPFKGFESLTVTEADSRVRRFLCMNAEASRRQNTISVRIDGFQEEAYFVLRLFGEEISGGQGAEWTELESGSWLIRAYSEDFQLELRSVALPYYR